MQEPGLTTNVVEISIEEVSDGKPIVRDVALRAGEVLTLILGSNPGSTGASWTDNAQIGDPAVVQQSSHEYVPPSGSLPGAPGKDIWTFKALKAGKTTIEMDYRQPWAGGEKSCNFTANITVH